MSKAHIIRIILFYFRTSQQKTIDLHLFNVVVVVDRVIPTHTENEANDQDDHDDVDIQKFIPSIEEQATLMNELVFLFATSIIQHIPQMNREFAKIYPSHLPHQYSPLAGVKTKQVHSIRSAN